MMSAQAGFARQSLNPKLAIFFTVRNPAFDLISIVFL
jgi:hypothetical protein